MSTDCKLVDYDCIALKLRDVISLTDKFYSRKIKELGLPILMNHMPLFYILSDSKDPSQLFLQKMGKRYVKNLIVWQKNC